MNELSKDLLIIRQMKMRDIIVTFKQHTAKDRKGTSKKKDGQHCSSTKRGLDVRKEICRVDTRQINAPLTRIVSNNVSHDFNKRVVNAM